MAGNNKMQTYAAYYRNNNNVETHKVTRADLWQLNFRFTNING